MDILLCEDDVLTRKMIKAQLENDGYSVRSVCDGKQGLFAVEHDSFELIILDLLMPFVNGFEFISLIKQSPYRNIPIIVLSKLGDKKTIDLLFSHGADYFLPKPFDAKQMESIVNETFKCRERTSSLVPSIA